jgi:hypothetical protein
MSAVHSLDVPERARADGRVAPVADELITELRLGRIRTVAFVVLDQTSWTLPLYEVAIATARRGWSIGIVDARYWFVTPEPEPLAGFGRAAREAVIERLEPEGVTFVGSTYASWTPPDAPAPYRAALFPGGAAGGPSGFGRQTAAPLRAPCPSAWGASRP